MNTIHHKWLRPMPSYWQDFSDRDSPMLAEDWTPPRVCEFCGKEFTLKTPGAMHRIACYSPTCERARKNRNDRLRRARLRGEA